MTDQFCSRVRKFVDEIPERSNSPAVIAGCSIVAIAFGVALVALAPSPSKVVEHAEEPVQPAAESALLELQSAKTEVSPAAATKPQAPESKPAVADVAPLEIDRLAIRVYGEYPELDPSSPAFRELKDWDKVTRLRDYSYRHTAFAATTNQAAFRAGSEMVRQMTDGKSTLADAYKFFDEARGGVGSREAAELLQRLCAWAGYQAECLEIGAPPIPGESDFRTYAVTLVHLKAPGPTGQMRPLLSVHDPSLNFSYGDSQGKPIDYFDILEVLRRRQADQVRFIGEVSTTPRRSDPITVAYGADLQSTRPCDFAQSWSLSAFPVWSATPVGNWFVRGPRTIWSFEQIGEATWKSALYGAGLPPESIYLHCFPRDVRGSAESAAILRRAQQALSIPAVTASDSTRMTASQ